MGGDELRDPDKELRATIERIYDYLTELADESDRGAAILAAANFDYLLGDIIEARFCTLSGGMSSDLRKQLFEDFGLFYTFAAKINIACALGLYDADIRKGLRTIKKIRNKFAHESGPIAFDGPEISSLCEKLDIEPVPEPNNMITLKTNGGRARYLTYLNQVRDKIYKGG